MILNRLMFWALNVPHLVFLSSFWLAQMPAFAITPRLKMALTKKFLKTGLKTGYRTAALAVVLSLLATLTGLVSPVFSAASAQNADSPQIHNGETNARLLQLAQAGNSASQILGAVYPTSSLATAELPSLRVFLADTSSTTFTPEGINRVTIDDQTLFRATPGTPIRISLENDRWFISGPDNVCPTGGCIGSTVNVLFGTATSVTVGTTAQGYFHGRFTLTKNSSQSYKIVLDSIRLDDYLKGLNVSSWNWPAEALKARAIEARSYILSQHNARSSDPTWNQPFEVFSASPDLPYLGDGVELNPSANPWVDAVVSTAGTVLSDSPSGPSSSVPVASPQPPSNPPASNPASTQPTPGTTPASGTPSSFTFSGRGWGHGVGMSQYGAYGRAAAGHNYQQILNFYYPNTSLGTQTSPVTDLRIFLATAQSTSFTPQGGGQVYLDGQPLWAVSPGSSVGVRLATNAWHITVGGTSICPAAGCSGQRVHVAFATGSSISVPATGRSYSHGRITLSKKSGSQFYIVLDSVTMEDYLLGIAEMPTDWHLEAQKVQAVAARSYAYAVLNDRRRNPGWILPFDIYSNTQDQAFIGDTREKNPFSGAWKQAVTSTANQVLLYNGNYAVTHYSSSNGGYVSEDIFRSVTNRKPYLQAAPDSFDSYTNPYSTWQVTYSNGEISSWLNTYSDTSVGSLRSISISGHGSQSGRINTASVTLTGSSGTKTVSGSRFFAVVNAGSIRQFGYSRTLRSSLLAVGSSYPTLPSGSGSPPAQGNPGTNTQAPPSASQPAPSATPANQQPVVSPDRLQPDRVELTGSLDSLRYENGILYATGTAIALPNDDLSVEFLIDESTVRQGTLNRQLTIQTSDTRATTGAFGFNNSLNVPAGPHSVCLFIANGEDRQLVGCRLIGLSGQKPDAAFESLTASAGGSVTLAGWAYDIDNIFEPVEIRVLTRQLPSGSAHYLPTALADMERSGLKETVNELAARGAWEIEVPGLASGTHEFCTWAANTNSRTQGSTFMGCRTVVVS